MTSAVFLYGFLFAIVMTIARFGGPIVWMFVWAVMAGQLALGAILVWKRTRLPLLTAGFAIAACGGLVLGFLGRSHAGSMQLLEQNPSLIVGMVVAAPVVMSSEQWVHPEVWRQVKEHHKRATLRDILAFRHIPDLRVKAKA